MPWVDDAQSLVLRAAPGVDETSLLEQARRSIARVAPGVAVQQTTTMRRCFLAIDDWVERWCDANRELAVRDHASILWLIDTDVICQPAKQALQAWLTRLVEAMHGRIHGFNVSVAHVWAEQERLLERAGQRLPVEDSYIAATARRHRLTIVTGNDQDFRRPGLRVFNPFKELPNL
jgi:hypothetical protein